MFLKQRPGVWVHEKVLYSCLNDVKKKAQAAATGALKRGREELPHVRGQGQKPEGPHARRAAAKRSYPTSELRGSGRECQTATAQEGPRGATGRPRSGGAAERRYPASEVRGGGREELPQPLSPRSGAAGRRSYRTPLGPRPGAGRREEQPHTVAARAQEGLEELSHVEGQEGRWWGDTLRPR